MCRVDYEVGQFVVVEIQPLEWCRGRVVFVGEMGLAVEFMKGGLPLYRSFEEVRHYTGDENAQGG